MKPALNENIGSEKLLLYQPFIFSPADLTRSVYFHLLFHCHYFPYLVLVFVFKFNCTLGNRYFWRCMLEHTKRQHKWRILQHALSSYVYNRSLFAVFMRNLLYALATFCSMTIQSKLFRIKIATPWALLAPWATSFPGYFLWLGGGASQGDPGERGCPVEAEEWGAPFPFPLGFIFSVEWVSCRTIISAFCFLHQVKIVFRFRKLQMPLMFSEISLPVIIWPNKSKKG